MSLTELIHLSMSSLNEQFLAKLMPAVTFGNLSFKRHGNPWPTDFTTVYLSLSLDSRCRPHLCKQGDESQILRIVVRKDNGSLRREGHPVPAAAVLCCLLLDSSLHLSHLPFFLTCKQRQFWLMHRGSKKHFTGCFQIWLSSLGEHGL